MNPLHQKKPTVSAFFAEHVVKGTATLQHSCHFYVFHVKMQMKFPLPDPFLFLVPYHEAPIVRSSLHFIFSRDTKLSPVQSDAFVTSISQMIGCALWIRCFGPRLRSATCPPMPEDFQHRPNPDFMPLHSSDLAPNQSSHGNFLRTFTVSLPLSVTVFLTMHLNMRVNAASK